MPIIPRRLLDAIQLGVGKFYHLTMQLTLPPGATITFSISPAFVGLPADVTWVHYSFTISGVTFPTIAIGFWHSHRMMVYHYDPFLGSIVNQPYYYLLATSADAPEVLILTNPTAAPLTFDLTGWIVEFSTKEAYIEYENVVRGEWRLLRAIGELATGDVRGSLSSIIDYLKVLAPPAPPELPRLERPKHPTMAEDLGKPIRRIEIP